MRAGLAHCAAVTAHGRSADVGDGRYAQAYHLQGRRASVTETVEGWRKRWPDTVPLPHPSPRNRLWLLRNAWFESELLPALRGRVSEVLDAAA